MSNVQLVHSKRIGVKTAPITYTEDGLGCYVWTKSGRSTVKEEIEQAYYGCSGCRAKSEKDHPLHKVLTLKFNVSTNQFLGDPAVYDHICSAMNLNQVRGVNIRRSVQAELAAGIRETSTAARVRIDGRIVHDFPGVPEADVAQIRDAAVGSVIAVERALYRAKRKKHPNINTFKEFLAAENRGMRLTLRGTEANEGHQHFGEQLLLHGDDDMLIFSSTRQLSLLSNCTHIISDGTFKYAPKGTKQIYRVFGLIRGTHATPLVTVLLKKKSKDIYKRMWQKMKEALSNLAVVHSIRFANFDAEIAAYSSFQEVFPGVAVKLCSFHVKQGLYRKVQSLGLSAKYQADGQLQTIVRMLGALQITPMVEWMPSLQLLRTRIADTILTQDVKEKVESLLQYFQNTWLSLGEIFCLFAYSGPRTTNHAESYHSKQRLHFSINSKLGHWAMVFKQDKILHFLSSDDGMFRGELYVHRMSKYLKRVGRLMGIKAAEYSEVLAEDEVEANQLPERNPAEMPGEQILDMVVEENPAEIQLF